MTNYARNVDIFNDDLKSKLEEKYKDPEVFETLNDEVYYYVTLQNEQKKFPSPLTKMEMVVLIITSVEPAKKIFKATKCLVGAF